MRIVQSRRPAPDTPLTTAWAVAARPLLTASGHQETPAAVNCTAVVTHIPDTALPWTCHIQFGRHSRRLTLGMSVRSRDFSIDGKVIPPMPV
ncbi:hypothetical protein BLAT2472_130027 [Burkholderia latens]